MSTTLNIPVNVPQGFNMNLLVAQLTEYAKVLVAASTAEKAGKKHYKHEALSGIFADDDASQEELVEEYLAEKYRL